MDINDVVQWVGVGIVLVLALVWIVRRITRKKGDDCCSSGCDDCPLKEKCK